MNPIIPENATATAVVSECAAALAFGLNGVAFNMLAMAPAHEDFLPYLRRLPAARPFWERWVAHAAGLPTAGLWPAWSNRLMARRAVQRGVHRLVLGLLLERRLLQGRRGLP